nr:MAG TPA: hypothetical protein [Caudoviricetes sp.]
MIVRRTSTYDFTPISGNSFGESNLNCQLPVNWRVVLMFYSETLPKPVVTSTESPAPARFYNMM